MKQINSLEELIETIQSGNHDFFIGGGLCRSSKYMEYDDDIFYIFNEIDDTEQTLTKKQLFDEDYTNIGTSINNGTFYAY
jgi:hypothetical protein